MNRQIQSILQSHQHDKTRLIDMLWALQKENGYLSDEATSELAEGLNMSAYDVRETLSFYHFFCPRPFGKHKIYLADTVIAKMNGYAEVRTALQRATGAQFGSTDKTGQFGLADANCIGLSDQEPAMMVDDVVFTRLNADKVNHIIGQLKQGKTAAEIACPDNHPASSQSYVDSIVESNIQQRGKVFFESDRDYRAILQKCLDKLPLEIIEEVTESALRGRGGAGFPTGLKWRFGNTAEGAEKYIICNADGGEPGTFKDRVLLSRSAQDVLLGMVIAAYAIGSRHGIIYLRAEYWYLKDYLQQVIDDFRQQGLLGKHILDSNVDFDIRIQMGAGAYVCGDETALIESCEGKRGTPRVKPPYPIQQGYLGMPTCVNNVETFACVSQILDKGAEWFRAMGTDESSGSRLLSVSGDCSHPGIYEIEWGITLNEVLDMVGARDTLAVQISGPSGECVSARNDGQRQLCYADLSCNGSMMIFNESRDLLSVVRDFMAFFVDESCGICTPCRAGNVDLLHKMELVIAGRASQQDLDDFIQWGKLLRATSRCGLGTTSPKPILTTLEKFPHLYQQSLVKNDGVLLSSFDIKAALKGHDDAYQQLIKREVS